MADIDRLLADRYLITMRITAPGRPQDFRRYFYEIWDTEKTDALESALSDLHGELVQSGKLNSVRKGTFVLSRDGFDIAGRLLKDRQVDNARLFLMKGQRRDYRKRARRLGSVTASADLSTMTSS